MATTETESPASSPCHFKEGGGGLVISMVTNYGNFRVVFEASTVVVYERV